MSAAPRDGVGIGCMVELSALMEPVLEAVEGYRAKMEAHGYGDALSRKMAADYHAGLVRMVLK